MIWITEPADKITQGSIVDGIKWGVGDIPLSIVLSNACDLSHEKSSFLIVAALVPALEVLSRSKEFHNLTNGATEDKALSSGQWKSLSNMLKSYIHNKNICRYYFFDPQPVIDCGLLLVDFQLIQSVPIENIDKFENVGQMKSPFTEQMMMRFTSYTARIPSDRVGDKLEEKYIQELSDGYHQKK